MATNFDPPTRRSNLVLVASTALVFLIVSLVSSLEKALIFSTVFAVFLSIVQTKRDSRRDRRFWIMIAILAIIHLAILSLVQIPTLQFGLMVLPFALVDGFAMWGLINWIDRRFPRSD
jgi:nicotinamide riboside transporter PnuC